MRFFLIIVWENAVINVAGVFYAPVQDNYEPFVVAGTIVSNYPARLDFYCRRLSILKRTWVKCLVGAIRTFSRWYPLFSRGIG